MEVQIIFFSLRIRKDIQFNRHRAFNLLDLIQIVCDDSKYYSDRCADFANNTLTTRLRSQKSRYLEGKGRRKVNIDPAKIVAEEDGTFTVPSETKKDVKYTVNMELRICTCYEGRSKGPCKHKTLVSLSKNIPSFDIVPETSSEMRSIWMYIAIGKNTRMTYFMPLTDSQEPSNSQFDFEDFDLEQNDNITLNEAVEMLDDEEENDNNIDMIDTEEEREERRETAANKLKTILGKLEKLYIDRLDHDLAGYENALTIFEKRVDNLPKTGDERLKKAAINFGETATEALSVRKRKKGGNIPVQVTAKSRRKFALRGSKPAKQGRPKKGTVLTKQLEIAENDEEHVYYKLPDKKKAKKKNKHNLMDSVAAIRGPERKH